MKENILPGFLGLLFFLFVIAVVTFIYQYNEHSDIRQKEAMMKCIENGGTYIHYNTCVTPRKD